MLPRNKNLKKNQEIDKLDRSLRPKETKKERNNAYLFFLLQKSTIIRVNVCVVFVAHECQQLAPPLQVPHYKQLAENHSARHTDTSSLSTHDVSP